MSKSYHKNARKFDDDFDEDDVDTKNAKRAEKFTRQLKRVFREERDMDS
jgi:hypothetical protein